MARPWFSALPLLTFRSTDGKMSGFDDLEVDGVYLTVHAPDEGDDEQVFLSVEQIQWLIDALPAVLRRRDELILGNYVFPGRIVDFGSDLDKIKIPLEFWDPWPDDRER